MPVMDQQNTSIQVLCIFSFSSLSYVPINMLILLYYKFNIIFLIKHVPFINSSSLINWALLNKFIAHIFWFFEDWVWFCPLNGEYRNFLRLIDEKKIVERSPYVTDYENKNSFCTKLKILEPNKALRIQPQNLASG